MTRDKIPAFRRRILLWYARNGRDLPWRHASDPYAILVSEIMLQQTQVATVIPFYRRWLERFPTIQDLASASEDEVLHAWQGLGYYSRARNLHAAAELVSRNYRGVLPRNPESLRHLPGMGRYTANAIATFAFNQAVPIVEANIARVLSRLFNVRVPIDSASGRERLWTFAEALVPKRNAGRFNSALMDLGATICTRIPQCRMCPVKTFCRAPQPELLPMKKPPPKMVRLIESHQFVRRDGHLLLERCSNRWRGMWMLPSLKQPAKADSIHSAVFPFTNHRITLRVFRAEPSGRRCACLTTANYALSSAAVVGQALRLPNRRVDKGIKSGQRWVHMKELDNIAIPSPHRRAINACLSLSACQSGSDR